MQKLFLGLLAGVSMISIRGDDPIPILSHYPDCDYQVIDTANVQIRTTEPTSDEVIERLLGLIQSRAEDNNAEAIILIEKSFDQIQRDTRHFPEPRYVVSYEAELISLCGPSTTYLTKPTPYDSFGRKAGVKMNFATSPGIEIKTTIEGPKNRRKHQISDNSINLDGSFYGVNLGASYTEVTEILGDPNVELFVFENYRVIGYGRSHWLYFENDKVVKLTSSTPVFSLEGKNRIPLIDLYDDFEWSIEGQLPYKSSVSKVEQELGSGIFKINGSVLEHRSNQANLRLNLDRCRGDYCPDSEITGFELFSKPLNQKRYPMNSELFQSQLTSINAMLTADGEVNSRWDALEAQLGRVIGTIFQRNNRRTVIINPHLSVMLKGNQIQGFHLSDPLLAGIDNSAMIASLMNYQLGDSYAQLKSDFPDDAFDIGYQVQFTQGKLRFEFEFYDDGAESILYDLKVLLN